MTFLARFCACLTGTLLGSACAANDSGDTATGGATGAGAAGKGGAPASGGSSPGTGGTGGAFSTGGKATSGGSGPVAMGGSGAGGAAPGTGGGTSVTGGSSSSGGAGGVPSGGTSGASATGGRTGGAGGTSGGAPAQGGSAGAGAAGAATGGSGVGGAGSGDGYVSDVNVSVHPQVKTLLNVTWTQTKASEQTWLEFGFPGGSTMTSRPAAGATGAHRDVVLGVPGSTAVTLRVVSKQGGVEHKTKDYSGTTGLVPSGMPKSTVMMYDATLASRERWLIGAVENSTGGCTSEACYFDGTWWLFAMDRQGRIVWYYADPATNDVSSFPRQARDGEYLFVDKHAFGASGTPSVLKMSLDRQYFQTVSIPMLSDCVDMTSDGSLLYDTAERNHANPELREMTKQGTDRAIWNCAKQFGANFLCYSNTVNWNPTTDTVLLSFPEEDTVAEIDRKTGMLVATYGAHTGSYAFSPSPWSFGWNHFPVITPQGTLLISSHLPGFDRFATAAPNHHAFEEFEIDRANKRLVRKWLYGDAASDGAEWAYSRGMAVRTANGNTLANYGSGGVIREITPDKKTVFYVKFDVATGNDYYNKLVGNTFLIDDLYALNGAPK